jgi:hypothetical protein
MQSVMTKVPAAAFVGEYHGHRREHLEAVLQALRAVKGYAAPAATATATARAMSPDGAADPAPAAAAVAAGPRHSFIYLVGDSSLDNKFWLKGGGSNGRERAVNGMESALEPPMTAPDVAHQINKLLVAREAGGATGGAPTSADAATAAGATASAAQGAYRYTCINAAVEESTIGERLDGRLFPQDEFVRDNITSDDVVVCSVMGNDVALKPSARTIAAMGWLTRCSSTASIEDGSAWGLGHFSWLAHDCLQAYLRNLTAKARPRLIITCVIYHLDENKESPSWANTTLNAIGYNDNPRHIQALLHRVYLDCFVNNPVVVPGSRVVPIELSRALDGKDSRDYVARVEPSAAGGAKMAALITDTIFKNEGPEPAAAPRADAAAAAAADAAKVQGSGGCCIC